MASKRRGLDSEGKPETSGETNAMAAVLGDYGDIAESVVLSLLSLQQNNN